MHRSFFTFALILNFVLFWKLLASSPCSVYLCLIYALGAKTVPLLNAFQLLMSAGTVAYLENQNSSH
jgi:hypothetical protein